MANKYDKDVFEEYFHINPELSRIGTDMLRAEKQAAGLAGKRIVYTGIGFTRIVCRFRYSP